MIKPIIVVAAYRRKNSIRRLLESLLHAQYPDCGVEVLLSLDGGYSQEVLRTCEQFKESFSYGSVEIIKRSVNLGLREHILWCGDQSNRTGSVIVLEDDLVVDPQFYFYAKSALSAYEKNKKVGGIALYSQEYNEYAGLPFKPLVSNYTGYFMQVACSWGQAWSVKQWESFKSWYLDKSESDVNYVKRLPQSVKNWPESSWKKYFSAYLVIYNLYFFYPYRSYTTNFSDPGGQHNVSGTNILQANLAFSERSLDQFNFPEQLSKHSIFYDSFMEACSPFLFESLGLNSDEVEIDIFGIKPADLLREKKFAITTKKCKKHLDVFFLNMKPIENSLIYREKYIVGPTVFLVETEMIKDCKNELNLVLGSYLANLSFTSKRMIKPFFFGIVQRVYERLVK